MIINENCESCKALAEKLKEYDEVFEGHATEVTDLEIKLYDKTKECEEWKNKYYNSTTEVKADLIKQLDQLKVENKEYKDIINKLAGKTIVITSGDKPFEFCDHKDLTIKQLKLDKETYKYQWEKQYELCEYWYCQAEKYKQALHEIKEIVQNKLSLVCKDCVLKQCKTCEAKQILQKCEVIDAK